MISSRGNFFYMMRVLFFILGLFTTCSLTAQVVVNSGLTESIFINPGNSQTIPIKLKNNSNEPRRVTFELSDYINDCDLGYVYVDTVEDGSSCKPWIELENDELILIPREEREFLCRISVPGNYSGPSAKACLFVNNSALVDSVQEQGTIQFGVQIRYGVNILYSNPKAATEIDLYAQKMTIDTVKTGQNRTVKISVLNRGNASTSFTSKIDIIDNTGQVIASTTTTKQPIQPQQCRTVSIDVKDLQGNYEILVVNETSDGQLFGFTDAIEL